MLQARKAWAADVAQACLKNHRCDLPRQCLTVSQGARAAYVDIIGKWAISAGGRKLRPTQMTVPCLESEPCIMMLDAAGPLSKAHSRVMVSRDDPRAIEVVTAE